MKNKGFTLVELLAVIVILAVILIIAVPQIAGIIKKAKTDAFISSGDLLESAAEKYVVNKGIVVEEGTTTTLDYTDIKNAGYITDIVDPMNNSECTNSKVLVTNNNSVYEYQSGLICDNYLDIDKYNLIENHDFSEGTTGWGVGNSSVLIENNILTITGDGVFYSPHIFQVNAIENGYKYYEIAKVRVTNSNCTFIDIGNGADGGYTRISNPQVNNWYTITNEKDYTSSDERFLIVHRYVDSATANGKSIEVDLDHGLYLLNLTEIYGSGNEPTKEEMDAIFENMK